MGVEVVVDRLRKDPTVVSWGMCESIPTAGGKGWPDLASFSVVVFLEDDL